MNWSVVEVKPKRAFSLLARFADGLAGTINLSPDELTGVLEPLQNAEFFAQAYVDHGAVTWPGDIDLAPDAMYRKIQQQNQLLHL